MYNIYIYIYIYFCKTVLDSERSEKYIYYFLVNGFLYLWSDT